MGSLTGNGPHDGGEPQHVKCSCYLLVVKCSRGKALGTTALIGSRVGHCRGASPWLALVPVFFHLACYFFTSLLE
jgi:hypothetical protein